MARSIETNSTQETQPGETMKFRLVGVSNLLAEAHKKSDAPKPLVVLMAGTAAVGKTTGSMIAHHILRASMDHPEHTSPHVTEVTATKNPSQNDLLTRGILDTDFFFHERNSIVRKTRPFSQWFRATDFSNTFDAVAHSIAEGSLTIPLNNLYDRSSGKIKFTDTPHSFPLSDIVIVCGLYAFETQPFFEKYGIPTLRILVKADRSTMLDRFLRRNKGVLSSETAIINHVEHDIDPMWELLSRNASRHDLVWESNDTIVISKPEIPQATEPMPFRLSPRPNVPNPAHK